MRPWDRYCSIVLSVATLLASGRAAEAQSPTSPRRERQPPTTMWINHLDLLPGDPSVTTTFNALNSGVGSGLSGLIIQSSTVGDTAIGGNKVVETGVQVPPGYFVKGVRICYGLSNTRSFITQVRLVQVEDPPRSGAIRLSLRLEFGNTSDRIVLLAIGFNLALVP